MKYTLYKRHGYLDKTTQLIKNKTIREYDLKDAGYTILTKHKMLSKGEKEHIKYLTKQEKNIYIGTLCQSRSELIECINDNLVSIRQEFQESNEIDDDYILSIKRDAIFVKEKVANNLKIQGAEFRIKNTYNTFVVLDNNEFYYSKLDNKLDIKGLGKDKENVFTEDLKFLLSSVNNLSSFLRNIKKYRKMYLSRELDLEHYRELNDINLFLVKRDNLAFYIDTDEIDIEEIDITYNYMSYIIPLYKLVVQG